MSTENILNAIANLQRALNLEGVDPRNGLPLELFEFTTALLPFVNVDLLIENSKGQILLSWRDDKYYGTGWQIPGGIIRMMESIDERIQKTAMREIGSEVIYDEQPIAVHENIISEERSGLTNQLERAHNIALLYKCRVPENYMLDNGGKAETDEGFLKWFDKFPDNLLECHKRVNVEYFKKWR